MVSSQQSDLASNRISVASVDRLIHPTRFSRIATKRPPFRERDFSRVLELAVTRGASDIHLSGGGRVALRVGGELEFLPYADISLAVAEGIVSRLMDSQADYECLKKTRESDFLYQHRDGSRYRCNAYYKNGAISLSMRRINSTILPLDAIRAPIKLKELIRERQGLILICGPTGHGKTTTMAAMIEEMNQERHDHILTLEDPVEHVFESKHCLISQRSLHTDTLSFDRSLRAAMRQDPDVIVVGEVRDRETARAVFNLVATGHLVITTVHATNAAQTLYRIARMFGSDEREMILHQMADILLGITNQRLVRSRDGGRVAIFEMLVANYAVRNAIRNGDVAQLMNTIATSADEGMLTFEHSAGRLIFEGIIDRSAADPYLDHQPTVEFFV